MAQNKFFLIAGALLAFIKAFDGTAMEIEKTPESTLTSTSLLLSLPDELLVKILNYKGIAKQAGGVCHLLEQLRRHPQCDLKIKLTSPHQITLLRYSYSKAIFTYTPCAKEIIELKEKWPQLNYISFKNTNVTDVTLINGIYTIDLSRCKKIRDVSALGEAHTLSLSSCENVTDVSALGKVHTLDLSDCPGITDVAALGAVRTLSLRGCRNVTDVSALSNVYELDLRGCSRATNISALSNVPFLKVDQLKFKPYRLPLV